MRNDIYRQKEDKYKFVKNYCVISHYRTDVTSDSCRFYAFERLDIYRIECIHSANSELRSNL